MADFDKALRLILKHEGGYQLTDDPNDPGGRTFAGISHRANPGWDGWILLDMMKDPRAEHKWGELMRDLKRSVRRLYEEKYWEHMGCHQIDDQRIANIVFSTAVLSGHKTAAALLMMSSDHEAPAKMTLLRIARFARIAEQKPNLAIYFRGWVNRALADFAEDDQ